MVRDCSDLWRVDSIAAAAPSAAALPGRPGLRLACSRSQGIVLIGTCYWASCAAAGNAMARGVRAYTALRDGRVLLRRRGVVWALGSCFGAFVGLDGFRYFSSELNKRSGGALGMHFIF